MTLITIANQLDTLELFLIAIQGYSPDITMSEVHISVQGTKFLLGAETPTHFTVRKNKIKDYLEDRWKSQERVLIADFFYSVQNKNVRCILNLRDLTKYPALRRVQLIAIIQKIYPKPSQTMLNRCLLYIMSF